MARFLLLLLLLTEVSVHADDKIFRGEIDCVGPYMQHSTDLPDNSIHLHISWDPIFANSDVALTYPSLPSVGVMGLSLKNPSDGGPQVPYFSGSLALQDGSKFQLYLNEREDRIPEGGPIDSGDLMISGSDRHMKCQQLNSQQRN